MTQSERVVRLSPEHADSPIWFLIGPVDFGEAKLSSGLEADLKAWEESFYGCLDEGYRLRPEFREAIDSAGNELAHRLASELGARYRVEYRMHDGTGHVGHRSEQAAENPVAQAAFDRRQAEHDALMRRIERARAEGAEFGWFASPAGEPGSRSDRD